MASCKELNLLSVFLPSFVCMLTLYLSPLIYINLCPVELRYPVRIFGLLHIEYLAFSTAEHHSRLFSPAKGIRQRSLSAHTTVANTRTVRPQLIDTFSACLTIITSMQDICRCNSCCGWQMTLCQTVVCALLTRKE